MAPDFASTEIIGLAALLSTSFFATAAHLAGRPRRAVEGIALAYGIAGTWAGLGLYLCGLFTDLY
jgi:hypothetical protein